MEIFQWLEEYVCTIDWNLTFNGMTAIGTLMCAAIPAYILWKTFDIETNCEVKEEGNGFYTVSIMVFPPKYITSIRKITAFSEFFAITAVIGNWRFHHPLTSKIKSLKTQITILSERFTSSPTRIYILFFDEKPLAGNVYFIARFNRATRTLKILKCAR